MLVDEVNCRARRRGVRGPMSEQRPMKETLARALGLTADQARAALGAVRAVAEADGPPGVRAAQLLAVVSTTLDLGADWLRAPVATPAVVGAAFPDASARRALVDALLIPACIEGEVSAAGEAMVRSFAAALGVRSPWVGVLGALRARRVFAVQRQLVRRAPDGRRVLQRTWQEEGYRAIFSVLWFLLGRHRDPALAARYRALAGLPVGTLGRRFHDDLAGRNLAFPGEAGGLPERMIHHDLMHVVNEYDTEPAGECMLAGFYAGFAPGEWFTFIVVALATFHLGLPVSPAIVTPARHAFDPARVLAAYLRGRRLRVDVMGPWDYWALMPWTIEAAREHLGIAEPAA